MSTGAFHMKEALNKQGLLTGNTAYGRRWTTGRATAATRWKRIRILEEVVSWPDLHPGISAADREAQLRELTLLRAAAGSTERRAAERARDAEQYARQERWRIAGDYPGSGNTQPHEAFTAWARENRSANVSFLNSLLGAVLDVQAESGVPWQVKLAQITIETGWGESVPIDIYDGRRSFNLHGIKFFGNMSDTDRYVLAWTREHIDPSELGWWTAEHARWARRGESLEQLGVRNGTLVIRVIQPFRVYGSYGESILDHSAVLGHERYAAANVFRHNPFIYLAIIAPIYATDVGYIDMALTIMRNYFVWDTKDEDWEEFERWRNGR